MSDASQDRSRQDYTAALENARLAAARAVEAMDAYAAVCSGPWRNTPAIAAARMRWELEFAAGDEAKRRVDEAAKLEKAGTRAEEENHGI